MNITKELELDATERFEMEYNGHSIWFEAKKETLTPRFIEKVGDPAAISTVLSETLTKWDVDSDDEGTMWPLDSVSLSRLPVPFLSAIANKIAESWSVDKKKPQDSANGSAAAAK